MSDQDQPTPRDLFEAIVQTNGLMADALKIIQQQDKKLQDLEAHVLVLQNTLSDQKTESRGQPDHYFAYLNKKSEFMICESLALGKNLSDRLDNVDDGLKCLDGCLNSLGRILRSLIEDKRRSKWWAIWDR